MIVKESVEPKLSIGVTVAPEQLRIISSKSCPFVWKLCVPDVPLKVILPVPCCQSIVEVPAPLFI